MRKVVTVLVGVLLGVSGFTPTYGQDDGWVSGSSSTRFGMLVQAGDIYLITAQSLGSTPFEINVRGPEEIGFYTGGSGVDFQVLFVAPVTGGYEFEALPYPSQLVTGDYQYRIRKIASTPLEVGQARRFEQLGGPFMAFSITDQVGNFVDVAVDSTVTPAVLPNSRLTFSTGAVYFDMTQHPNQTRHRLKVGKSGGLIVVVDLGDDYREVDFAITATHRVVPSLNAAAQVIQLGSDDTEDGDAYLTADVQAGTTYRLTIRDTARSPFRLLVYVEVQGEAAASIDAGIGRAAALLAIDIVPSTTGRMVVRVSNQDEDLREVEVSLEDIGNE